MSATIQPYEHLPADIEIWWGIDEQDRAGNQYRHAYTGSYRPGHAVTGLCGRDFTHRPFNELETEQQYSRTCPTCERHAWWIRNRRPHPYWDTNQ